jgi:hypothetical protein
MALFDLPMSARPGQDTPIGEDELGRMRYQTIDGQQYVMPERTVKDPNVFGDVGGRMGNEMLSYASDRFSTAGRGEASQTMQGLGIPAPVAGALSYPGDIMMSGLYGMLGGIEKGVGYLSELSPGSRSTEQRLANDIMGGFEVAGVGPEMRLLEMLSAFPNMNAAAKSGKSIDQTVLRSGFGPVDNGPAVPPRPDQAPLSAPQVMPDSAPAAQTAAPDMMRAPDMPATTTQPVAPALSAATPPAATATAVPQPVDTKRLMPMADRKAIRASAPRGRAAEAQEQVIAQKSNYPAQEGWAQDAMQVTSVAKKKDGLEVKYKEVPYQFDRPPMGVSKDEWKGTLASRAVDEIKQLADRVKSGDPAAQAIMKQANWYRGMRTSLRKEFGGMGDVFADLLGATSAQTGVEMNWNNAVEVMRRFSRGEYDKEIKAYEDMVAKGEANPTKLQQLHKDPDSPFRLITNASGALFNANSPAATKALLDMFRVAGGSPKTPNFTGNLIGYTNAATVDVWAARFLRRLSGKDRLPPPVEKGLTGKHLKGSTLENPNVGGEFGFGQQVLKDAADQVNKQGIIKSVAPNLADMNPDDLQAVAWFIEKEKWTQNNWTSKAGEGGSFEFEASLAGAADPASVKQLRRRAIADFKAPKRRKTETDEQYAARVDKAKSVHDKGSAEAQKQLEEIKAPLTRYVLGISVERPGARPSNTLQAETSARLGEPVKDDKSVVMYQINNTYGRFMKEDERAFNAEFVVRQNFDPTAVTKRMIEVAKDADQDAAFVSKVVPNRTENSRPGVEIYFSNRQGPDFARALSDKLSENGIDGFTFVTDARVSDQPSRQASLTDEAVAGINGLRFQYIPEFEMGADAWQAMSPAEKAAKIDEVEDIFDAIAVKLEKTEKGISAANLMHYETNVYTREQYDGLLRAPSSTANQ